MNFIAVIVALGVEQWRTFRWRGALQRAFIRYARWLEGRFNGGTAQQGALAAALALAPAVLIAAGVYWALDRIHPLLALAWNVAALYLLVGFRHFSHAFAAITTALKGGDAIAARRKLAAWRGADAAAAGAE
ncbi:MAG TPA: CobD/CbiB family protein, partial [Casimicrobiaceae bacterium]|nr:CobD/CbiB family protein [Casimicrobiaceae bacterium]